MEKIIEEIKKKSSNRRSKKNKHLIVSHGINVPRITMTLDEENEDENVNNDNEYSAFVDPQIRLITDRVIINNTSNINNTNNNIEVENGNRKQSTGTLNRLMLVAEALETEVHSYHQSADVNGARIVAVIRAANVTLLLLVNVLIATGAGQYHGRKDKRLTLLLTIDKWYFQNGVNLPPTFAEMRLSGQYLSQALSAAMLLITVGLQFLHCCRIRHSKLVCICYSFGCVPFSLLVFGLEMHYSACPWLDDFYRSEVLRRDFQSVEKYFDIQCGINGWALAGICSLLSCGLFVSEGLITVFFRSGSSHYDLQKMETIL